MASKIPDNADFLRLMRARFKRATDATETMFRTMIDDLNFLNGDQWDAAVKAARIADDRPCLTINKGPAFLDQVVGDQRQNRPSIRVRPVDGASDVDTAKVLNGLIRNIEVISDAPLAYDTAFDGAAACGFGAYRVITEYAADDVFDQDIKIDRIQNQFSVYWDPAAKKPNKSDGGWFFITEKLAREEFEEQYPGKALIPFEAARDDLDGWATEKEMRVAEYFVKRAVKKTLYLLEDAEGGQIVSEEERKEGYTVVNQREVNGYAIDWYKVSGTEILEGPTEWAGRYFPIVVVWGKELNIENRTIYRGVIRHYKDAQKLYNYNRSMSVETVSLAPRAPYVATPAQIGKYKAMWNNMHKKNFNYLLYDPDLKAPGAPQRQFPSQLSTGIQQEVITSDQEMHDTTGLQLAAMGKKSNEKSGKAIEARQREGDVGQFAFVDSLVRSLRYTGKVLVDLIPRIYDVPRIVRIIGEDDSEEMVQINEIHEKDGKSQLYDLTTGKYDVTVQVGPSYTTQRQEASAAMTDFIQAVPAAGPLIGDLIAKNQDWPGTKEIQERLQALLPPELRKNKDNDQEQQPDQEGQPEQGGPEQMAMAAAQTQMEIEIETAEVKLAQEKAKLEKMLAEAHTAEVEARAAGYETTATQDRQAA